MWISLHGSRVWQNILLIDLPYFKTIRLSLITIHNVDVASSLHLHLATFGHDMSWMTLCIHSQRTPCTSYLYVTRILFRLRYFKGKVTVWIRTT